MKTYVRLWLLISTVVAYEYLTLNFAQDLSLLHHAQTLGYLKDWTLTTLPGKRISLILGWTGFGIMAMTNIYSLRKRFFPTNRSLGSLGGWLNFHIFCGLVGPTLILFHTNFKIGGLVAVSFWSMVISFSSGIVGRYFYLQLAENKKDLEISSDVCWTNLKNLLVGAKTFSQSPDRLEKELSHLQTEVLAMAGAGNFNDQGILGAIMSSLTGDFRLRFSLPGLTRSLPNRSEKYLKEFAIQRRRAKYLTQFQEVMGYWHSFHTPFAFLMYGFALIHIVTALLLMVPEQ